jgi:hypothetical protein
VAGYSGTPLAKKLGIKPEARVALLRAPEGFEAELEGLPDGVDLRRRLAAGTNVVVLFTTRRRDLERRFEPAARAVRPDGSLWVAWPKRSSGVETDLTEDVLRDVGLPHGLVDNKVCAVDDTWSGLRFVWRLENR